MDVKLFQKHCGISSDQRSQYLIEALAEFTVAYGKEPECDLDGNPFLFVNSRPQRPDSGI